MRKKLLAVVFVLLALVALDFGGRWYTEYQVNTSTKTHVANVGSVSTDFGQPPFGINMTLDGKVHDATIDLRDLAVLPIGVHILSTHVVDLKLDRGKLLGGKARITGTGQIDIVAVLSAENVRTALSGAVVFRDKYIQVTIGNKSIYGKAVIDGRDVLIKDPRYPTRIPMPSTQYLPCQPTSIDVRNGGALVLACTSKTLPPVLLAAIGSKGLQDAAKSTAK